jgi:hypothetical protein
MNNFHGNCSFFHELLLLTEVHFSLVVLAIPGSTTITTILFCCSCCNFVAILVFTILTAVLSVCRFIVLSSLLCCGGFIYKTRAEHLVFLNLLFEQQINTSQSWLESI